MSEKKEEKTTNFAWDRATQDRAIATFTFIRRQLITKHIFYAVLSMRLQPRIATPWQVISGCWCAATDGKYFYINPDGWLPLNPRQQAWVMRHEILHCVLRHPTRIATRHTPLWNIACLVGNTKITMADGSLKPIENIKPGEHVASPFGPSRVLGHLDSGLRDIVALDVGDGSRLLCTEDHRFFTQKGLLQAGQIKERVQGWGLKGLQSQCEEVLYDKEKTISGRFELPGGRSVLWDTALLGYFAGVAEAVAAFHGHMETTRAAQSTDAEYVGDLARTQGAKSVSLQVLGSAGRAATYDLITEHHTYYANGVLVHNCDYVVNMIITKTKEDLPLEGVLWDDRFQKMDADSIYQILKDEFLKGNSQDEDEECQDDPEPDRSKGDDKKKREADEFRRIAGQKGADPHSTMMDPFEDPKTGERLSPEDAENAKTQIENAWKAAFTQARLVASEKGNYPLGIDQVVERENAPRLPWERLLQQWVQARIREGYDWMRPNKRFVADGTYLPGRGKPSLGDVVVLVDTSGSVSDKLLSAFLGEIEGVLKARPARVFLVACDVAPFLVGQYENANDFPLEIPIKGRGGTDFRPGVQWIEDHSGPFCKDEQYMDETPRLAIYLTDGMGDYPQELPEGLDMLWVLSRNWEKDSKWYPPVGEAIIAFKDLD